MKNSSFKIVILSLSLCVSAFIMPGCRSAKTAQKGASIGAGTGVIVGAFVGKAAGNTALGAIIGGSVGGTAGALIGRNMQRGAYSTSLAVPGSTVVSEADGIVIRFDSGLLFDLGSADIQASAKANLQNLANSLKSNPQTNIVIIGNTDDRGTIDYNQELSVQRAEAVKSFMLNAGVDAARLTAKGKGETDPIGDNATEQGRAANRRVDIVIMPVPQVRAQAK